MKSSNLGHKPDDRSSPAISAIVPALNETGGLAAVIARLQTARDVEVIGVDGGSDDGTPDLMAQCGAKVVRSGRGRARQMNAGAAVAGGHILVFVHADTLLPLGWDDHVRCELLRPGVAAGAFELSIDGKARGLRCIEALANFRSRALQMPYGDQAIFLRADTFREVGGFPDLPVMEDFALMRSVRDRGRISIVPVPAVTSARRWDKLGICRTTATNQLVIAGYLLGVSPERLARFCGR